MGLSRFAVSPREPSNGSDTGQGCSPECLYSEIHRLYVKSKCNEKKQKDLRICVELVHSTNPVFGQSLTVQLTDDNDPFFLYGLALTEEDFKDLKVEQGLLVDFDRFPGQLLRLLTECGTDSEQSMNKFFLVLDEPESDVSYTHQQASLKVLETNNFRQLCHLCLNISKGNDTDIKKQMALKIKQLKDAVESREKQLSNAKLQLEDVARRLDAKTHEIEELQRRLGDEKTELHINSVRELAQEREKCANMQLEWQRRLVEERTRLEEQHAQVVQGMEAELARLRSHSELLSDKHRQAENLNRELSSQLEQKLEEAKQLELESANLRKDITKLEGDYHRKEKESHCLSTRLTELEQVLKDRSLLISKQTDQLNSSKHKQAHLEELLAELDRKLQKKQVEVDTVAQKLNKANEYVTKQYKQCCTTASKVKLLETLLMELERRLTTTAKELEEANASITKHTQRVAELAAETRRLEDELKAARAELEEKTNKLRICQNTVNWLYKQQGEGMVSSLPHRSNVPRFIPSQVASAPLSAPLAAAFQPRNTQIPHLVEKSKTTQVSDRKVDSAAQMQQPVKNSIPTGVTKPDLKKSRPPLLSAYFPK